MTHQFSQVPKAEIQRSSFDRSHGLKTAFDGGWLIPVYVDEALPGDSFNLSMTALARLATPIFPYMDNLILESFFFAVPNRLLWENWERFNGARDNPDDNIDFTIPMFGNSAGAQEGDMADYMGIPIGVPDLEYSVLWARAYNLIWNEWFRDQNLQDSEVFSTLDAPGNISDYTLMRRGKRHDYFTSCLPWPNKSDPVSVPLGTQAPVSGIGMRINQAGVEPSGDVLESGSGPLTSYPVAVDIEGALSEGLWAKMTDGETEPPHRPDIFADLTDATAVTINVLRQAFAIQRLTERDARGGTRYTEIIRAHFGVTSPDARLQRPEYLGGGSTPITTTPVPSTVPTDLDPVTPQATLAGYSTGHVQNHGFTKSFTEHCTLIGLVSVRADLTYQQGLNRMWSRLSRYDFYWGALSHIGEQAVLNKEIYAQGSGNAVADAAAFGYQERFAEYRYKPSSITSSMRSKATASLDAWHLSQDFESLPVLGDQFIRDTPPIDRIIAVEDEPHFIFDAYFSLRCARPMPLYGVPGLIDHF